MLNEYSKRENSEIDVASFRRYVFRRLDGIVKDVNASPESEIIQKRLLSLLRVLDQIENQWALPASRRDIPDLGY